MNTSSMTTGLKRIGRCVFGSPKIFSTLSNAPRALAYSPLEPKHAEDDEDEKQDGVFFD